jgi:hypothetical protein
MDQSPVIVSARSLQSGAVWADDEIASNADTENIRGRETFMNPPENPTGLGGSLN